MHLDTAMPCFRETTSEEVGERTHEIIVLPIINNKLTRVDYNV